MHTHDDDMSAEMNLDAISGELMRLFKSTAQAREPYERRMLSALRQYHGEYDEAERPTKGSKVFVNLTRNKTVAGAARLKEMVLPNSGDKNWGVSPTPQPDLAELKDSDEEVMLDDGRVAPANELAKTVLDDAKTRAEAMEREIHDQLQESLFGEIERDVIFDAAKLGTGVMKGPVIVGRERRAWRQTEEGYGLIVERDMRPRSKYVNPLFFYPDMSATEIADAEFVFEVSGFMSRRQVRELAKYPNYIASQVRRVLSGQAEDSQDATVTSLLDSVRTITGDTGGNHDGRFHVIEYHGPIKREWLDACGCEVDEDDELADEVMGVVVMIGGHVVMASPSPMSTGEIIYDVFNWEEDEGSIFGFGIPHLMENEQRICNSAWRMALDNGALSVGPQVVARKGVVRPADGVWELSARKLWIMEDDDPSADPRKAFSVVDIPVRAGELLNIYSLSRQMADEVTNLPLVAQGETANIPETYRGMALLMNSANITIRRAVRRFDDRVTKPHIRRYYDWNMEFSDKDEIKGDMDVVARGTSQLLQREQQLMAMQQVLQLAAGMFAPITDLEKLWKDYLKLNDLDPESYVKPPQQKAEQPQQADPDTEIKMKMLELKAQELDLKMQKIQGDLELKAQELSQEKELKVLELASREHQSTSQSGTMAQLKDRELTVKEKVEALRAMDRQNEMALKAEMGSGI